MFFLIGHTLINSLTNSLSHIQQLLIYFGSPVKVCGLGIDLH